ncbi:MAG TPA: hypothetical protein VK714_18115 [Myxococcota bacterium]|nr:hypothetical protein [Myxococcota bacterium]
MTPKIETTPNPSTDIARIPPLVLALRASFDAGTTRPISWRKGQLDQIARLMDDHGEDFLAALKASFETFSHHKSVVRKSTRVDPKIAYPPYTKLKTQILKRLM